MTGRIIKMAVMMACIPLYLLGQWKIERKEEIFCGDTYPYERRRVQTTRYFEVGSLEPVFDEVSDSSSVGKKRYIVYYMDGVPQKVSMSVFYKGGYEKYQHDQDSLYWEYYKGPELNVTAWYTILFDKPLPILFDKELRIREIKIVQRKGYTNDSYDYDALIKKVLMSMEDNWEVDDSWRFETDSFPFEYYFLTFRFILR